jgi:hypothetical protein
VAGEVDGLLDQGGLVGVEDDGQADHAGRERVLVERAVIVHPFAMGSEDAGAPDHAAEALELGAGGVLGDGQQALLVGGGGDAGLGTDLGVGEDPAAGSVGISGKRDISVLYKRSVYAATSIEENPAVFCSPLPITPSVRAHRARGLLRAIAGIPSGGHLDRSR